MSPRWAVGGRSPAPSRSSYHHFVDSIAPRISEGRGGGHRGREQQTVEPQVFTATRFAVRCGATTFALGDLDHDGALDVVAGGPGDDPLLTARLGDGHGDFSPVTTIEFTAADEIHIANFADDGAIDIAVADHATGTVTFAPNSP